MAPKCSERSVIIHVFIHKGPEAQRGYAGCPGSHRSERRPEAFDPKCLLLGGGTWKQVLKELMGLTAGEAGEPGLRGTRESVGPGLAGAGRGELGGEKGRLSKAAGQRRVWDWLPRSGASKTPKQKGSWPRVEGTLRNP